MSMDPFDWIFPEGHVNWGIVFIVIGTPVAITFACYSIVEIWKRCMECRSQCLPYQHHPHHYGLYDYGPPGPLEVGNSPYRVISPSHIKAKKANGGGGGGVRGGRGDQTPAANFSSYSESIGYGSLHGGAPPLPRCPPPRRCSGPALHCDDPDYCGHDGISVYATRSSSSMSTRSTYGESAGYSSGSTYYHSRPHHQHHGRHHRQSHRCDRNSRRGCVGASVGRIHGRYKREPCSCRRGCSREPSVYYGRRTAAMTGSCSAYDCSGESLLESGSGDYYDYVDIDRCGRGCGGGGVGNKASPQKPKPILQAGTSSPELEDSGMVSGIEAANNEEPVEVKLNPALLQTNAAAVKKMFSEVISNVVYKPEAVEPEEGQLNDNAVESRGVNTTTLTPKANTQGTNTSYVKYPSANAVPAGSSNVGTTGFGGNRGFGTGAGFSHSTPKASTTAIGKTLGLPPRTSTYTSTLKPAASGYYQPTSSTANSKSSFNNNGFCSSSVSKRDVDEKPKQPVSTVENTKAPSSSSNTYGYKNSKDLKEDENPKSGSFGNGGFKSGSSAATTTACSGSYGNSGFGNGKGFGNGGFGSSGNKPSAPIKEEDSDDRKSDQSALDLDDWARDNEAW